MSDGTEGLLAVGDEVRVHFHPPGSMRSFCEGVVSRVDVTTPEGRFFAVEVQHEVILNREHRIRPGFHDFVRYECPRDFAGRIESLSAAEQDGKRNLASDTGATNPPEEPDHEADEPRSGELTVHSEPETEQQLEGNGRSEPAHGNPEPQPVLKPSGLLAALFGRRQ